MVPLNPNEFNVIASYDGKQGTFVEGFIMNDKRNKNGWRATWESIKNLHADFIGRPGIVYAKCDTNGCIRSHTTAKTFKAAMSEQEKYRVSNIIATKLHEDTHTLTAIERITDKKFEAEVKSGEPLYRSPSMWATQYEVVGDGQYDIHEWKALHNAYVTNPAFGKDVATNYGTCMGTGHQCKSHFSAGVIVKLNNDSLIQHGDQIMYGDSNTKCTSCDNKRLNKLYRKIRSKT